MNILIVANHYAVASGRYATEAFRRLGHDVRTVGPAMGRQIWGMELPAEYVWEPDEGFVIVGKSTSSSDYALSMKQEGVETFKPDCIVVMDSDPKLLDQQANAPATVPIIVWGVDNHVRDYRRPWFDHYFLAHQRVSEMLWNEVTYATLFDGEPKAENIVEQVVAHNPDMTHLPCCYDPTLHVPSAIPWADREYDVCMIGVMYPERWRVVNALRAAGFKVLAGTGLVYEAYVEAYHNSRISLCISSNGDVAQRVFETARMGCVVVSDPCSDYTLLKPEGIFLVEDGDYIGAVQEVLRDPVTAQVMASNGQAWAEPYSWDHAAQKVVEWYTSTVNN